MKHSGIKTLHVSLCFIHFFLFDVKFCASLNEWWLMYLAQGRGGKGYFRHSSKLFYTKGIAVGQPTIFYHSWVCWWTLINPLIIPLIISNGDPLKQDKTLITNRVIPKSFEAFTFVTQGILSSKDWEIWNPSYICIHMFACSRTFCNYFLFSFEAKRPKSLLESN